MPARLAMNGWLAVTLALGGCGRLGFEGVPDASSDSGALPDARPDAGPRLCPPTLMFDEDGDGVDDACDVCPHVPDGPQADQDGDGVGDPCDPQPATPAEYLAWFDGFNGPLPAWTTSNPLIGGQMVIDVTSTSSNSVINLSGSHWQLDVGGELLALGPTPHQFFIAGQVTLNDSYYVELIDAGGGRRRSLMHVVDTTYTELDGSMEPGLPVPLGRLVARLSNVPDQLRGTLSIETVTTDMFGPGNGTIDTFQYLLYVQGMSVVLDYAVVIQAR